MGPMHWIREWGLTYGIYPWVSTLVMEIEGRNFWVERGCFLWGGRGREEELQGTTDETFSQTTIVTNSPFMFILYIAQWKFRCSMRKNIANGGFHHGLHGSVGAKWNVRVIR
jgi:hypothetical protein